MYKNTKHFHNIDGDVFYYEKINIFNYNYFNNYIFKR